MVRRRRRRRGEKKKDVSRHGERGGEEPSAAMRVEGEERKSRQPRSQTVKLCAKREGRVRTIGSYVRSCRGRSFVIRSPRRSPRQIYARSYERGRPVFGNETNIREYSSRAAPHFGLLGGRGSCHIRLRSPNWSFSYRVSVRATPVERLHTQLRNADKAGYARE